MNEMNEIPFVYSNLRDAQIQKTMYSKIDQTLMNIFTLFSKEKKIYGYRNR